MYSEYNSNQNPLKGIENVLKYHWYLQIGNKILILLYVLRNISIFWRAWSSLNKLNSIHSTVTLAKEMLLNVLETKWNEYIFLKYYIVSVENISQISFL